jgi:23S rRNA (cytidine1920-2'-O)/16S rRNA (cytidine1409-2'-O)-methyltransferase
MSERLRLDSEMQRRGIAPTRSQAENYIRLGKVKVNGKVVTKPGHFISAESDIALDVIEQYVSRAGMKLASVAKLLNLDFKDKVVLDVGSSTGGFTDYSLKHGAKLVYAVDVGTKQLHPSLHGNSQIELHEQTDIRDFIPSITPDIILMDVSFVSSRLLLPHLAKKASNTNTQFVIMVKPQFEADRNQVNKGVIKNDSMRRKILSDFESWTKDLFVIKDKKDSEVAGAKGNRERFYLLKKST